MSEKIAAMRIRIQKNLQYYIKDGDIWARPRAQPGQPNGKSHKVADVGILMESDRYLYYVDSDGDVARTDLAEQLDTIQRTARRVDALAATASQRFESTIWRDHDTALEHCGQLLGATAEAAATAVDAIERFCTMMIDRAMSDAESQSSEDES